MSDRQLFENLEVQQAYVADLTIALRESQGGLDSLRDHAKAVLSSRGYVGKAVLGVRRLFYLDSFGEVASLEIADPKNDRQAISETEIDRIMSSDWQPRFGFGPFSHRKPATCNCYYDQMPCSCSHDDPVYLGWDEESVVRNGESS